jgi:hypothetical protein
MAKQTQETTFEESNVGEMETMDQQTTETQETQQGAAATGAPAPADLTVQDLQALKVIIDVASQRGAFRPNEMQTVGATYTKLEQFLGAIAQAQSATAQG